MKMNKAQFPTDSCVMVGSDLIGYLFLWVNKI